MELLEYLVNHEGGLTQLLAGLVIVLCLYLTRQIINDFRKSDGRKIDDLNASTKENTKALQSLSISVNSLNDRIVETDISASKTDRSLSRLVATVKELAGDRWGDIQKKVKDDEFIGPGER